MKKIKSSRRFLIIFITSLLIFTIAYPLTYNALVTKDSLINHSYKDFLLRYTKSPRLIIDSGSNSLYGINSKIVEKELGILTINLADNGSYPLREKLYRLEKFARKGDVILIPLEWNHYFIRHTEKIFLDNLFDKLNFYYNEMSFITKLQLIAETPFSSFLKQSVSKNDAKHKIRNEYFQLIDYKNKFNKMERGDYEHTGIKPVLTDWVKKFTCNEAILGNHFMFSTLFKKNILLINEMQKKGIPVIFTWPVVVGDNCYQGESYTKLKFFIQDIKNYLNQNDILIVGEPEDSLFKSKYMFDSYYHVIPYARDIRTKRLIAALKKSNAKAWFNLSHNINYSLSIANIDEYQLKMHFIESLNFIANEKIINSNSNNLFLVSGWYAIEPWGVWSKDNESVLYVKLDNNLLQHDLQLTLENDLYKTHDKTTVLINDKKLGDYLLEGRKSIVIPSDYLTDKTGLVKIQFNHSNVKSPLELGINQDDRKLKFGLKSLQFTRLDN